MSTHPLHPARVEACLAGAPIPGAHELDLEPPVCSQVRSAVERAGLTHAERLCVDTIMGGGKAHGPVAADALAKVRKALIT